MGQPRKNFALPKERLASRENSEGRRQEYTTPSTGRMTQNPATVSTHHTRFDEKLRKIHRQDWKGVQVPGKKILLIQGSET